MRRSPLEPHLDSDPAVQLCVFRVGYEKYALDLRRVEEILRTPRLARVPQAPSFIEGVIHFRGSVVPMVDLRKRFGLPTCPPAIKSRCMICRLGRERVAIQVDGPTEVLTLRISELYPPPTPGPGAGGASPFIVGVCGAADELKFLLDLKALFVSQAPLEIGDPR
jgi:purine-binding chemotaxis protein CheW